MKSAAASLALAIALACGVEMALAAAPTGTPLDLPPAVVHDRPIGDWRHPADGWTVFAGPAATAQRSGYDNFYAPGSGPRCDFSASWRGQGRFRRACD